MSLSPAWRTSARASEKQLQRVFQLSAPWVLAIASLNVIEFFLA